MSNNNGYNNSNLGSNSNPGSGSSFNLFSSSPKNGLSESSSNGFFSNISWVTIVGIIFVLAILGFNIFSYLAKGTQNVSDIFGPMISYVSGLFGNVTADASKEIINTSATGTIGTTDITANTLTSGINLAQHGTTTGTGTGSGTGTGTSVGQPLNPDKPNNIDTSKLSATLNSAAQQPTQNQINEKNQYEADDSYSSIQSNKSTI